MFRYITLILLFSTQFLLAQTGTSRLTFTVDMSNEEVAAEGIFVTGNFFNGLQEPLDHIGNNIWVYTLAFSKGDSLFYRFENGEQPEEFKETTCLDAERQRRLFVVPDEDEATVPEVCFNHCTNCCLLYTSDAADE